MLWTCVEQCLDMRYLLRKSACYQWPLPLLPHSVAAPLKCMTHAKSASRLEVDSVAHATGPGELVVKNFVSVFGLDGTDSDSELIESGVQLNQNLVHIPP